MSQELHYFNGIDAVSGSYLLPPLSAGQLSDLALGLDLAAAEKLELAQRAHAKLSHAGVEADARRIDLTGWGVIFPSDAPPEVIEALQPLLDLRREQAGERFKLFSGPRGVLPGESKDEWLAHQGVGPGPAQPDKVPYYLLLVAGPQRIPFRFQYQLDVQYAVGRLYFPTLQAYYDYARSVVLSELGQTAPDGAGQPPRRRAVFFGTANHDDGPTRKSADHLVNPLASKLAAQIATWNQEASATPGWRIETLVEEHATKARLLALLGGDPSAAQPGSNQPPALHGSDQSPSLPVSNPSAALPISDQPPELLFAAMHGLAFPNGHALQAGNQGALLCQDWPGPLNWQGEIARDHYFAAEDLSSQVSLRGSIAFFYACFAAGTPQADEFAPRLWSNRPERRQIAPQNFLAALPQKMLSLPRGGALAVVGHVERAWSTSFQWNAAGPQITVFADCFQRLIKDGYPLGYALEVFNERYAELASLLTGEIEEIRDFNKKRDNTRLASLWTAHNDARNYVILGDPAVRAVGSGGRVQAEAYSAVTLAGGSQVAAPEKREPALGAGQILPPETNNDAAVHAPADALPEEIQHAAMALIRFLEQSLGSQAAPANVEEKRALLQGLRRLVGEEEL